MRSLTAAQFAEWQHYEQVEPFGEAGLDRRFALLAGVVAGSAGAMTKDGRPYTADTYRNALSPDDAAPTVTQTADQMELHLKGWMDLSNAAGRESGYR